MAAESTNLGLLNTFLDLAVAVNNGFGTVGILGSSPFLSSECEFRFRLEMGLESNLVLSRDLESLRPPSGFLSKDLEVLLEADRYRFSDSDRDGR